MRSLFASLLTIDPRTLGLARIGIALLLLFDLGKRAVVIATWYSNSGLLPNHTFLWRPIRTWQMSFLWMCSHWYEAAIAFSLIALVYLALLVGYRTRLAQALSLFCLLSLHVRVDLLANGGDFVFGALLWWTVFLPLGQRFSVDAVRQSMRTSERNPPALRTVADRPRATAPVWSLAVLAALTQLAVIYFFNAVSKSGPTWIEGTSIHYLLQQERILTPLGLLARHHLPFVITQAMTYATLVIEGLLPFLILSPFGIPWTRRLAIFLIVAMHTNIGLVSNLGIFSPVMCVFGVLLLTKADWDAFQSWARGRRQRILYFDDACGVCFQLARLASRLDTYSRVDLRGSSEARPEELPSGFDAAQLDRSILVVDPASGRYFTRSAAAAEVLMCLPFGLLPGWLMKAPVVREIANVFYDAFSRNRTRISSYLGYAACGITPPGSSSDIAMLSAGSPAPASEVARLRSELRVGLREAAVLFLIVIATAQMLRENPDVPDSLRIYDAPSWFRATVSYTRLHQGWKMFAPSAPTTERNMVVVAETVDGRHVDPVRAAASDSDIPNMSRVVVQPGYDVFWADYIQRIEGRGSYYNPLRDWIMAYHERSGNSRDRIKSFDVFIVEQTSPRPGESEPSNVRVRRFLEGP